MLLVLFHNLVNYSSVIVLLFHVYILFIILVRNLLLVSVNNPRQLNEEFYEEFCEKTEKFTE